MSKATIITYNCQKQIWLNHYDVYAAILWKDIHNYVSNFWFVIPFKSHHTPLSAKKLFVLCDTNCIQGLHMYPIKIMLCGKNQMRGTLHTWTVRHFKTPAVHKYYNSLKYSCTTGNVWVLQKMKLRQCTVHWEFLTPCIVMNDLHITWESINLILHGPCIILQYICNPTRYTIFGD